MANENLGPAERIIQTLLNYTDHMLHNRPGMVVADGRFNVGLRWDPATWKLENNVKVVYRLSWPKPKRQVKTRVGTLRDDMKVMNGGHQPIGEFRKPGLFPEVASWFYAQIAEVWKVDNEFAARWASYQFTSEHKDLKVALAAFMLCQPRQGAPVKDAGEVVFYDEDYRAVGEAMCLLLRDDKRHLDAKLLARIHDLLVLPAVAEINYKLGFTRVAKEPFLGRWPRVVRKWLQYREQNPKLLEGLLKAGYRETVELLCRRSGYKPQTEKFYELMRWPQKQAQDGRRTMAIGKKVQKAETWHGMTEQQICEVILKTRPTWAYIAGRLPKEIGLTRAIMAVAIETDRLSTKELIQLTPTIEELGLLQVPEVKAKWEAATKNVEDMRAANVARNVKSKELKEKLLQAADTAAQAAVAEVIKDIILYVLIDRSGSMDASIGYAKWLLTRLLPAFPLDKVVVSIFNTIGRRIELKAPSAAAVEQAFLGLKADGGTDYGAGVRAVEVVKPRDDQDSLMLFVGDEGGKVFAREVQASGLRPMAFGLLKVPGQDFGCVTETAHMLGIPCFMLDKNTFEDPYAIPRTLRNLIASTPVGRIDRPVIKRETLADIILKTPLLKPPAWA